MSNLYKKLLPKPIGAQFTTSEIKEKGNMMDKELMKAERAYNKAKYNLIKERTRVFPVGTKVILRIGLNLNEKHTVTGGSLHADQIHLNGRIHSSFSNVEKIK